VINMKENIKMIKSVDKVLFCGNPEMFTTVLILTI
jgi:hypothetical protein